MFPGPNATIYRNEAGEPTGWDYPPDDEPDYDALDADERTCRTEFYCTSCGEWAYEPDDILHTATGCTDDDVEAQ